MIEENSWPIEVLVEIFKWFSIEERLQQLAPVCKLFHQAARAPKFWKIVDTNSEFTLSSFHSVFGHAKHITHLDFRYSQRQLGCRNLIENALNDRVNLVHLDLAYNTSIFTLQFIQSMPFLRYLDITSCQNGKESSLTLSLKNKRGLQVLKMGNCFQIEGNSMISMHLIKPCTTTAQRHRANAAHKDQPSDYYRINVFYSFIDHVHCR